jgi:hypothetical protein
MASLFLALSEWLLCGMGITFMAWLAVPVPLRFTWPFLPLVLVVAMLFLSRT